MKEDTKDALAGLLVGCAAALAGITVGSIVSPAPKPVTPVVTSRLILPTDEPSTGDTLQYNGLNWAFEPNVTIGADDKPAKPAHKAKRHTARKSNDDCLIESNGEGFVSVHAHDGTPCKLPALSGDLATNGGLVFADPNPAKPKYEPPPPFDNLGDI